MQTFELGKETRILVKQVHEIGEWFGFETRNKYQIMSETGRPIAFAAEQSTGILGFIFRQYLGHWRRFDVHFFTPDRTPVLIAHHPFRWFFERIEISDVQGRYLGAIQKRFSIFTKRFDIENSRGLTVLEVSSPIWKLWTFNFEHQGRLLASVQKKWSGLLSEAFTDKDNFMVEYNDPAMKEEERLLIMASSVFIDLLYFEQKR